MINYIWAAMLVISFIAAFFNGNVSDVCIAINQGAKDAVELVIGISGIMALWTGIMKIAENSRLTDIIAKLLSPVIRLIFGSVSEKAKGAIAMNMTANLLGMGNAATPLGIKAMKELSEKSQKNFASDSMCMLAVVNSASIQLIPSTLIAIRSSFGSLHPSEIISPIWITSIITFLSGVIAAKIAAGKTKRGGL